jgi:hypothetical protein
MHRLNELGGAGFSTMGQNESNVLGAQAVESPAVDGRWRPAAGIEARVVIAI